MHLKAGQKLKWEQVSNIEFRVVVETNPEADPLKALGFSQQLNGNTPYATTAELISEIRAGE